jgi:hydrocephalus-inducing protein
LLNPYEVSRILINGDAFHEDIIFENLPNDLEDSIEMGDCIINTEKRITFNIKNNSESQLKFNFNTINLPDVAFHPSKGHLDIG